MNAGEVLPRTYARAEVPFGELLLSTMRHVQEHAAQLHLFLGLQAGKSAVTTPEGDSIFSSDFACAFKFEAFLRWNCLHGIESPAVW